jgi:hypothetical protein
LPGTWNILGELVTSVAENPNDPNAPKPGDIKPDTWTIQNNQGAPVLTSSSGSIKGQYTDNGAVFDGGYTLTYGVYVSLHIECFMDSSASMYGTTENNFWGTNAMTGEMIRLGIESWKFRATKK